MAMSRAAVTALMDDLRANRDQLSQDLKDLDRVIVCLERRYLITPEEPPLTQPEVQEAPEVSIAAPVPAAPPAQAPPVNAAGVEEDHSPSKRTLIPGIGLAEAITKAAEESRHNQTQIAKRVVELRPGTAASSAAAQVSTMLKNRVLHKGPDLIIRRVVDGKIQGLPVGKGEDEPYAEYGQYSSGAKE